MPEEKEHTGESPVIPMVVFFILESKSVFENFKECISATQSRNNIL